MHCRENETAVYDFSIYTHINRLRLSVLYVIAAATARNIKCLEERTNTIPLLGNILLHTQTQGKDTLGPSCPPQAPRT